MPTIGFIGVGNMGSALIASIAAKTTFTIAAFDVHSAKLDELAAAFPSSVSKVSSNKEVLQRAEAIFLAVKPHLMVPILEEVRDSAEGKLLVSIAAGISISTMQKTLGPTAKVIRVMPNTPCLVGAMAAGFALGAAATPSDGQLVKKLLDTGGISFQVEEQLLDAITGLSGSGPAFIACLIQWFTAAGVAAGIPEHIASPLSRQTFLGTAKLLQDLQLTEEQLKAMVTTPGGTTEAGRKILEASTVPNILLQTVQAATQRSQELGMGKDA